MRRCIAIAFFLFGFIAGCASPRGLEITVVNLDMRLSGDELLLDFDVRASGISIDCDGRLIVEFSLETPHRRLTLPVVVYSSATRSRYESRRRLLSDDYSLEPYHTYDRVKDGNAYRLDYRLAVPYQNWMEDAGLTYRHYTHDCRGDRITAQGVLADRLGVVRPLSPAPVPVLPAPRPPVVFSMPRLDVAAMASPSSEVLASRSEIRAALPAESDSLTPRLEVITTPPPPVPVWDSVPVPAMRTAVLELPIRFPVNGTQVLPRFGDNQLELARVDSLFEALSERGTIGRIEIHGYASPEGGYARNEQLARGRSEGFGRYLAELDYPFLDAIRAASVGWTPEDWEGLARLVAEGGMEQGAEVLAIVRNEQMPPDERDAALRRLEPWSSVYGVLLRDVYPRLRRIVLTVHYTEREN